MNNRRTLPVLRGLVQAQLAVAQLVRVWRESKLEARLLGLRDSFVLLCSAVVGIESAAGQHQGNQQIAHMAPFAGTIPPRG